MLLNCLLNSKKSLPVAISLLSTGLLVLCGGIAWQHAFAPIFHLSADVNDFFHGFCVGLGLTLEIFAVVLLARINSDRMQS